MTETTAIETPQPQFSYAWDWGETGTCTGIEAQRLQQIASQINRTVAIAPLQPVAPEPLSRDERTRLKAASLVLAEELEEAKQRGLELYRTNTHLAQQLQLYKVREVEVTAQLKDARSEIERLAAEVARRDAEHGELVAELERLRALESFTAPKG